VLPASADVEVIAAHRCLFYRGLDFYQNGVFYRTVKIKKVGGLE